MKRLISAILATILAFSVFNMLCFADSKKAISSYEDLCNIGKDLNGSYYLTGDINAVGEKEFVPLGSATAQFKGTLDGKGYSIIGLNIGGSKLPSGSTSYAGIFTYNGGTIKNLNFVDATVVNAKAKYEYAGVIAAINLGSIENCYVSGTVKNENAEVANYTGSISGQMLRGSITKCVSYANVYAKGGEQYTGGITGYNEKGTISEVAMYGSVFANGVDAITNIHCGGISGISRTEAMLSNLLFAGGFIAEKFSNVYLGGIVGETSGSLTKSVAIGTVTPSQIISHTYIGGIVGNDFSATVKDTYYLEGITNEKITCKTGTAVTTKAIGDASVFSGLDFSGVWEFAGGKLALRSSPKVPADTVISKLTGIEIEKEPKKLEYTQGDPALDLTGIKVNAVYTDKKVELQPNEYTVGGYNYVETGKQTITVSYKGFTDSFTINVKRSDKGVIIPEITDDSYFEGDSTGKVTNKKPSKDTTTPSKDSDKNTSSSTQITLNGVDDNMEDDEGNLPETQEGKDGTTIGTIGGADGPTDVKTKLSTAAIVIIILVAAIIVAGASAGVVFYMKRKKAKPQNEEIAEDTAKTE